MRRFVALCFIALSCSSEPPPTQEETTPSKSTPKKPKYEKLMKMNPPPKKLTKPEPIQLDIAAADVVEWQVKTNDEAAARIEACKGYQELAATQTDELKISTRLHQAISLAKPFWIFAVEQVEKDNVTLLNYCTLHSLTLEISCSPAGEPICP